MDRGISADVCKGHFHDAADAVAVNVVHAEGFDVVGAQDGLLGAVDVAEADVDEFGGEREGRDGSQVNGSVASVSEEAVVPLPLA